MPVCTVHYITDYPLPVSVYLDQRTTQMQPGYVYQINQHNIIYQILYNVTYSYYSPYYSFQARITKAATFYQDSILPE